MPKKQASKSELVQTAMDLKRANEALEALRLAKDFEAFFRAAWSYMDSAPLVWSWHYSLICEWITYAASGQFRKNHPEKIGVWFCVPPRTSKSLMVNVAFPSWTWTSAAGEKFMCISYGDDLATPLSRKRRDLIKSDWYQSRWKVEIKDDADWVDRFDNTRDGYMVAGTTGGAITGIGASRIVLDDLLKAKDAYSETARNTANALYDETLRSRLNQPAKDFFIGISQRLHDNDIVGFLREMEPERWIFVDIPLECEEDSDYAFPISRKVHHRSKGDILLPERFTPEVVAGYKKNPRVWSGQYQQKPSPQGGYIFPPDKWQFWKDEVPNPPFQVMSVDASFKGGAQNDYVAIHVYALDGPNSFMLDKKTAHLDFPATKQAIRAMREKWPQVSVVLIEDKANGAAIVADLKKEMPGVIAINPEGGKESRAHAASADVFSGSVYLPDPKQYAWVQKFIDLLAAYNGEGSVKHDDDVDAFTQFINWRRNKARMHPAVEWLYTYGEKKPSETATAQTDTADYRPKVTSTRGFANVPR
jgi:predicted phage terminase large subunit-like protein